MTKLSYHWCSLMFIGFLVPIAFAAPEPSPEERRLEQLMEIHYLNDKTKSAYDFTRVSGNEAFIQIWRDLPPEPRPDEIECLGYQWLISGRGTKIGESIGEVFKRFPQLQSLEIQLVDVDFSTESVDGHGKLKRKEDLKKYLRMKITRPEVEKFLIQTDRVKKELRSGTDSCLKVGRKLNIEKEIKL